MQKTRNRSDTPSYDPRPSRSSTRYSAFTPPELISADAIGTMLDDDLIVRYRTLDDDRNRVVVSGGNPRAWEEELAYIRREQQLRRVRRDRHADFVRKIEDDFARTEAGLPAGDFDNSAFVYAASNGRPRWS